MKYHFEKPDHFPADLHRAELEHDRDNFSIEGCMWQALGVMLMAVLLFLLIAQFKSPDESAAPRTKPSPLTGAMVGNSATLTFIHTMNDQTPAVTAALEKIAKGTNLAQQLDDLRKLRNVYGNAKGLAFHDYTTSIYDTEHSVLLTGTIARGHNGSDKDGSCDTYATFLHFIGAQKSPEQHAAANFIVKMVELLDAKIIQAEADLTALMA